MAYQIGDKVIPISKSVGCCYEDDRLIRGILSKEVDYATIRRVRDDGGAMGYTFGIFYEVCGVNKDGHMMGNNFAECDLIPYAFNYLS